MALNFKLTLCYALLGFVSSWVVGFLLAFCFYSNIFSFICTFILLAAGCYYAFLILTRLGPDQKIKLLYIIIICLGGLSSIFVSAMHAKDYLDYSTFGRFVIVFLVSFGVYALVCCQWPFILTRFKIEILFDEFTAIFANLAGAVLQSILFTFLFAFMPSDITEATLLGTLCLRAFGDIFLGAFGGCLIGVYTSFQSSQPEKYIPQDDEEVPK